MTTMPPAHRAEARAPSAGTRRAFLVGSILAVSGLAAGALRSKVTAASPGPGGQLEQLVPLRVGTWTDAPFADLAIPQGETAEDKSYDQVLTRYYGSSSESGIMLLIAYSAEQVGQTELHRPEVCYPAAGFKLGRRAELRLRFPGESINAASLTAVAPNRTEQLLYWTRIGSDFPTGSLEQRWSVLKATLGGGVPDGVLVRISTISGERTTAMQTMSRFAGELLAAGGPQLRRVLVGKP